MFPTFTVFLLRARKMRTLNKLLVATDFDTVLYKVAQIGGIGVALLFEGQINNFVIIIAEGQ